MLIMTRRPTESLRVASGLRAFILTFFPHNNRCPYVEIVKRGGVCARHLDDEIPTKAKYSVTQRLQSTAHRHAAYVVARRTSSCAHQDQVVETVFQRVPVIQLKSIDAVSAEMTTLLDGDR